jgi:hypothetical protein
MRAGNAGRPALRRRYAKAAAFALALAVFVAASAAAKDTSYKGPILDSTGRVEFKLKRDEGKLYVMHFHVDDLPYTCVNGTIGSRDFGIRRMRVKHRKFDATTYFGNFRGTAHAVVEGRLRPKGRARGQVFYTNGFDGVALCESGEMGWSAER